MTSTWQVETGHLVWHWSEFGQRDQYHPHWILESSEAPSGYIPPLPDFANHSPFGGGWLGSSLTLPDATKRYSGRQHVQGDPARSRSFASWRKIAVTLIDRSMSAIPCLRQLCISA